MDTVTLVDLTGTLVRTLSAKLSWSLEDRTDSTNRLTVTVAQSEAADVTTDMELLFKGRRFIINQLDRTRSTLTVDIEADEAQSELATIDVATFKLNQAYLSAAVDKALETSNWTVGSVEDDTGTYYADLENKKISELLSWLAAQSDQLLVFDSAARTVSLVKPSTEPIDTVFHYGVGVNDIKRTETPPTATVIHPVGANGLTVANVNDGSDIVEDYSWYVGLGLSLAQARKRYTRRYEWTDERYTVVMNLLRDAKKKLASMSQPSITYDLTSSSDITGLTLNERVYVVDETLGIRIQTTVSVIRTSTDHTQEQVTREYVPPSFGSDTTDGDTSTTDEVQLFQAFNTSEQTLGAEPVRVLPMSVNVYSDTMFEVFLALRVQTTGAGLLEGYFLLNGQEAGPKISETVSEGWVTIGLPFLLTNIPSGDQTTLDLSLSHTGSGTVAVNDAQIYIRAKGAYGGITNERPDRRVVDQIDPWLDGLHTAEDSVLVSFPEIIHTTVTDSIPLLDALTTIPVDTVQPMVWVEGTVLTVTLALENMVYTLDFENQNQATMPDVVDGSTTLDLSTVSGAPTGSQSVLIRELNVGVTVTL